MAKALMRVQPSHYGLSLRKTQPPNGARFGDKSIPWNLP
jgi:hypothetical protein